MDTQKEMYYLIRSDILPESIQKTIEAKRLLEKGEVLTIQQAVEKVGLSRSAYYKYKDAIHPFNAAMKQQILTIALQVEHRAGILSQILSFIAAQRGNVLTINQNIPLQGLANVVLSIETAQMDLEATELLELLHAIDGIQEVHIIGQG